MNTFQLGLIVLIIISLWVVYSFNRLVGLKNKTASAWADIDVQLKRRYDLITTLISVVQGYAGYERSLLEKLTAARTVAMGAKNIGEQGRAEAVISSGIQSIFAVAENYPDLKANQSFLDLQKQLSEIENNISSARRYYNGNVKKINTTIQKFPGNIIAAIFNYSPKEFFEVESEAERKAVEMKI